MSVIWTAADVAEATRLPEAGRLLMIQWFFDDSGTHGNSAVVVWGGVVGTVPQFRFLEDRWNKLLANPPHGRKPLSKFSQSDCQSCRGEFIDYSFAESQHLQYLFRSIILQSGVVPVTFGTDVAAWNSCMNGALRRFMGSAESASFGQCAKFALELAEINKQKVSIVFDQGGISAIHHMLYDGASRLIPEGAKLSAISFLPVVGTPGLQAADIVANYFYVYACE